MNAPHVPLPQEPLRIAGERVERERTFAVCYPFTGEPIARVSMATVDDVRRALAAARAFKSRLTRHDRYRILTRVGALIARVNHAYSHLRVTLHVYACTLRNGAAPPRANATAKWARKSDFGKFALPKANHKFLDAL